MPVAAICPLTPPAQAAAAAASDIPWHAEELCRLKPVTNSSMLLSVALEAEESRRWGSTGFPNGKIQREGQHLGKSSNF